MINCNNCRREANQRQRQAYIDGVKAGREQLLQRARKGKAPKADDHPLIGEREMRARESIAYLAGVDNARRQLIDHFNKLQRSYQVQLQANHVLVEELCDLDRLAPLPAAQDSIVISRRTVQSLLRINAVRRRPVGEILRALLQQQLSADGESADLLIEESEFDFGDLIGKSGSSNADEIQDA